ncbi:winged helix-turn-helix domain-containing protein [Micromonospora sp. NPDC048986]|uniref:winged helix-turn-helix domain-containing protein n=1 Tax=Micromonospora sp. NPDC048986 TaxID=3155644 RepID=UPI0033CFFE80
MIYPRQPEIGHRVLADLLRGKILNGDLAPGEPFPSDRQLQGEYSLGRDTVRDAVAILRAEGLIVVRRGKTSTVRRIFDKQPIDLTDVASIESRMPTPDERDDQYIDEGVPVFVVRRTGKPEPELFAADRWYIGPSVAND